MSDWTSGFESTEAFKEHMKDRMQELVGTRDLAEGNRRCDVVQAWRYGDEC